MGYTNSQQIMHADITFMLKDEIPNVTFPYVDDVPVKGLLMRYELPEGSYETIPENPNIRRFIWEHFNDINRILQRLKSYGATASGKKVVLGAPEAVVLGHTCNYSGRIPDTERPVYSTTLLQTSPALRPHSQDFSEKTSHSTSMKKHKQPLNLKEAIANSGAIRPIDYESDRPVYLCVNSSKIGYGAVILQEAENGLCYPCQFMSGTWNDRERNYSQPKIELFGLFRALYEARIYLIGLNNLFIEVDTKYIKGMINNPDLQPNATINRWIAGILLFSFTLIHVPASKHTAPDGLSRRNPQPDNPPRDKGYEDWIDQQYAFCLAQVDTSDDESTTASSNPNSDIEAEPTRFIPCSEKATEADQFLRTISGFLQEPKRPPA
ncbi:hypothetical protein ACEPAI_2194 [Sanghuangporus weigelae]